MDGLLPEPDLDARFRLDGPQVDGLLRELVRRRSVMTLFGTGEAFCTVVEAFGAGGLEVAIPRDRQDLVDEEALTGVALVDEVKVQLEAAPRDLVARRGHLRLRLERPRVAHRIQRREGYRVRPLDGDPGVCHIRAEPGGRLVAVPVLDASVVGVALAFPLDQRPPPIGATLERCQLRLVAHQLVPCDLIVRRHQRGERAIRVGCRLVPLSLAAEQCLQRTIMEIELRRAG